MKQKIIVMGIMGIFLLASLATISTSAITIESSDSSTVKRTNDNVFRIYGNVYNLRMQPIEDAFVDILNIDSSYYETTTTSSDGFYEFTDVPSDTYLMTASKKGYYGDGGFVAPSLDGEDQRVIFILIKIPSSKESNTPFLNFISEQHPDLIHNL